MKIFQVMAVGLTTVGFVAGNAFAQTETELYEAAKKEQPIMWYNGTTNEQTAAKRIEGFLAKYPGLKVQQLSVSAQVTFQRTLQELQANSPQADVYSTPDLTQFDVLKEQKALLEFTPPNAEYLKPSLKNIDPDGFYTPTDLVLIGMAVNEKLVGTADQPRNWTDLLDAKWKDQIGVGSPNFSGAMGIWVVAMEEKYGWEFFEKLANLNPLVGRSISDPITSLNAGERKIAAAASPSVVLEHAKKGNPLRLIEPADGFVGSVGGTAVMKASKSPNTAKLFVNFLLSKENAEIGWATYKASPRGDLKEPSDVPGTGNNQIIPSNKRVAEKLMPLREQWKQTMGGM